jgi:hypothetical protein
MSVSYPSPIPPTDHINDSCSHRPTPPPSAATVSEEVATWMSDIKSDTGYKRASAVAELVRYLRKWEDQDTETDREEQAGKRLAVRKALMDDMVWMIRYGDTYLQVRRAASMPLVLVLVMCSLRVQAAQRCVHALGYMAVGAATAAAPASVWNHVALAVPIPALQSSPPAHACLPLCRAWPQRC